MLRSVCLLLERKALMLGQKYFDEGEPRQLVPKGRAGTSATSESGRRRRKKGGSLSWVGLWLGKPLFWREIELGFFLLIHYEQHQAKLHTSSLTSHSKWDSRPFFQFLTLLRPFNDNNLGLWTVLKTSFELMFPQKITSFSSWIFW